MAGALDQEVGEALLVVAVVVHQEVGLVLVVVTAVVPRVVVQVVRPAKDQVALAAVQVPYLLCAATQALTALLLWCVHPVLMCQFVWARAQSSVEAVVCGAEPIHTVFALSHHHSSVFPYST